MRPGLVTANVASERSSQEWRSARNELGVRLVQQRSVLEHRTALSGTGNEIVTVNLSALASANGVPGADSFGPPASTCHDHDQLMPES